MVADIVPIVFLFFVDLAGALLRSIYPWLQERAANEKIMRELDLIPKNKLTEEQIAFIEKNSKPLNFAGRYVFTTIVGLIFTLTITIASFATLVTTLPDDISMLTAGVMAPGIFIMGWGGTSLSNQLLASKNATKDTAKKEMIAEIQNVGIVARAERAAATSKP